MSSIFDRFVQIMRGNDGSYSGGAAMSVSVVALLSVALIASFRGAVVLRTRAWDFEVGGKDFNVRGGRAVCLGTMLMVLGGISLALALVLIFWPR